MFKSKSKSKADTPIKKKVATVDYTAVIKEGERVINDLASICLDKSGDSSILQRRLSSPVRGYLHANGIDTQLLSVPHSTKVHTLLTWQDEDDPRITTVAQGSSSRAATKHWQEEAEQASYVNIHEQQVTGADFQTELSKELGPHYGNLSIDPISLIDELSPSLPPRLVWPLGNALKYIMRAPFKGSMRSDLEKALDYIGQALKILKELDNE